MISRIRAVADRAGPQQLAYDPRSRNVRGWGLAVAIAIACVVTGCVRPAAVSPVTQIAPVLPAFASPAPQVVSQAPRVEPAARSAAAIRFPYDVQPEWLATRTNYDAGRDGASIDFIVIHYTQISYARTLRAFNILASDVSAHYVVRNDGHVAQIVGEADTAWHAGNYWFNQHSIGIEIERSDESNPDFTAEEYYATAALVCAIAARHDIPIDRAHVVGHNEVPGSTHSDPGPTWGWPHFMWLTSLCAPPNAATVRAAFVSETAYPSIAPGERASVSVVLRNTGATAWRRGTPQEARLGVPGNDPKFAFLSDNWPAPQRVAAQSEDVVPPGGTATFTFSVTGELPGQYVLPLRPLVEGAAWMDDLGLYTVVTVH
jgi:N-acetyl-anhydromuramyl-L-alanine amidase AmpD